MYDKITRLGNAVIQHGHYNDRIYVMKPGKGDVTQLIDDLENLGREKEYSKISAKIPMDKKAAFEDNGYEIEAHIPGYYNGKIDVAFLSKYLDRDRKVETRQDEIRQIVDIAEKKASKKVSNLDISPFGLGIASLADEAEQMSLVYREVFATYPFPILESAYIRKTMTENVKYFYVRDGKRFVALSSAEMDAECQNVEMTDFATLPTYRGQSLAAALLATMENAMKRRGMITAYTIARSLSAGMNITFAKQGYTYTGTLTNNTNISGQIESMNVWYKRL